MNKTARVLAVLAGVALIFPGLCALGSGMQFPSGEFGGPGMVVTGGVLIAGGILLIALAGRPGPK